MADPDVQDLSKQATTDLHQESVGKQFERDLSHILMPVPDEDHPSKGPKITLAGKTLQFKPTAPIDALAALVSETNQLEAMRNYVLLALEEESRPVFNEFVNRIDLKGLGEIISTLGEGFTNFQGQS